MDGDKTTKAWPHQDDFGRLASRLVGLTFGRLGVDPVPTLGLVAYPSWREQENLPVVLRNPGLLWDPKPHEWKEDIRAQELSIEKNPSRLLWARRASPRGLAFEHVARERLAQHDAAGATISFLSDAASVWSYDVLVALEFLRSEYDRYPTVWLPRARKNQPRAFDIGLLGAVAAAVIDHLFHELCKGGSGVHGFVDRRGVDDVLRDAGERLLRSVQWRVLRNMPQINLFDRLNTLSTLKYERSEGRGGIVFRRRTRGDGVALSFVDPVPLNVPAWSRKTLQMANESFWIYSDTEHLLGLGKRASRQGDFLIRFKGHGRWELAHAKTTLADVRLGLPSFPAPRLRKADFDSAYQRVFNSADQSGRDRIWAFIDAALEQRHGTMVAVAVDAAEEGTRLATQATPVRAGVIGHDALFRATEIDGAILLDPSGVCHAIGVILDGQATPLGDPARVARFNSGVRYVNDGPGRLAVVISEDGHVDLLPRLRPPLERATFDAMLDAVRVHPDTGDTQPVVREVCERLLQYYYDYVPEDISNKVWNFGRRHPWDDDEDSHARLPIYEAHASDFLPPGDESMPRSGPHGGEVGGQP